MPNADRSSPEVIGLLETYLDFARKNPLSIIGIVGVGYGKPKDVCANDYAGDVSLELSLKDGLEILNEKLDKSIESWTTPPQDDSLDESYVCYNVANGPLGFDFITWLIAAEMRRIRFGAPGPLKVGFWMGLSREHMNLNFRKEWLEHVFRPGLSLLGALEKPIAVHGHKSHVFVPREIVAASRSGENVPKLKATSSASMLEAGVKGAVTITLRESTNWPHRNSNLKEWRSFANFLRQSGETVYFIRDTSKAKEPLMDGTFPTIPEASTNLITRMKVYQRAKLNFFVSNGPQALALYSDCPWICFIPIEPEGSPYHVNKPDYWRDNFGIEAGVEQYPWSSSDQRVVWKQDTYENIMEAWEEFQRFQKLEAAE